MMGILNGKHVFTSKFITAIIIDESHRAFFVAIEKPIGNYFLAKLGEQVYAFRVTNDIYTYRHTLAKQFQFTIFFTTHYNPVTEVNDAIELMLKENSLPRMNGPFSSFLRYLGKLEKNDDVKIGDVIKTDDVTKTGDVTKTNKLAKPHDLLAIVNKLSQEKNQTPEFTNLMTFIKSLPTGTIVTPVKPISDFIEDDLKATDPKFLGSIATSLTATEFEHKRTTNTPITAKKPVMKLMAVVLLISMAGIFGYIMYEEGYLDSIIPTGIFGGGDGASGGGFLPPTVTPDQKVVDTVMEKYPDPTDLKLAVESGEIPLTSLPKDIQKLLENISIDDIPIP